MKGVINDKEIEMISKLDAQMLLSEANIFTNSNIEGRPNSAVECCVWMRDNGQRDVLPLFYRVRQNKVAPSILRFSQQPLGISARNFTHLFSYHLCI